jgi:hypothetical protein
MVRDHVGRGTVGPAGADGLQCRQRVGGALSTAVGAPQTVVADRVTAVEVPDSMGAVAGRWQPVGVPLLGPARAHGGPDPERAELVEG